MQNSFHSISVDDFVTRPFLLVGKEWMLITAQKPDGSVNTMTASWGGFCVMWNKNCAMVVIRPSRYTHEFVEAAEQFSLSFFAADQRSNLGYLGRVSGRDEDKIGRAGLTVIDAGGVPAFAEAELIFRCRKIYRQDFDPAGFLEPRIAENYPHNDYHTLYLGEIEEILRRDSAEQRA